jgi:hypothetical protein
LSIVQYACTSTIDFFWLEYCAGGNYTDNNDVNKDAIDDESKDLFDSFRVFCNRKNVWTSCISFN